MAQLIEGLAYKVAGVRLNPKRRRFLSLYFGDARQNPTKAAELMGMSRPDVSGVHYRKVLAKVIAELEVKALEAGILGAQETLREISYLALHASTETNRLRALELMAKIHGLLSEKVTLTLDRKQLERDIAASMGNLRQDMLGQAKGMHLLDTLVEDGSESHQDQR